MSMQITNLLVRLLGQPSESRDQGKQHKFNCPRCAEIYGNGRPDNRYNLEVHLALPRGGDFIRTYHCWKCTMSGELGRLFKEFGSYETFEYYKAISEQKEFGYRPTPKSTYKHKLSLPKEYVPFFGPTADFKNPERLKAYNYLKHRRISDETIQKFRLGFAENGHYRERIILPSYDKNGNLNYFTGRSYVEHPNKYMNPSVDKTKIIFNESNINWELPVTLTEGPFEVLAYSHNNIPLLGKELYDLLLEKLLTNNARVILALNLDALEKSKTLANKQSYKKTKASSIKEIYKLLVDSGLKNVRWWKLPENDLGKALQVSGENSIFSSLANDLEEIDFSKR